MLKGVGLDGRANIVLLAHFKVFTEVLVFAAFQGNLDFNQLQVVLLVV